MYDDLLKKILIVEDDAEYRHTLSGALFQEYTVVEAADGEEAIEKLLTHKPDLVMLDMLLPKLDGFEVLKRIREYPDEAIAKTPVIILSNLSGNQDIIRASALYIDAYFVKSETTLEEVTSKIRQILFFKPVEEQKGGGDEEEKIIFYN